MVHSYTSTRDALQAIIESDNNTAVCFWRGDGNDSYPRNNPVPCIIAMNKFLGAGAVLAPYSLSRSLMVTSDRVFNKNITVVAEITANLFYPRIIKELYGDYVLNGHRIGDVVDGLIELRSEYKRQARIDRNIPEEFAKHDMNQSKAKALVCMMFNTIAFHDTIPELKYAASEVPARGVVLMKALYLRLRSESFLPFYIDTDGMFIWGTGGERLDMILADFDETYGMHTTIEVQKNMVITRFKRYAIGGQLYGYPDFKPSKEIRVGSSVTTKTEILKSLDNQIAGVTDDLR
ncbi:hypothetical protein NVP1244A_141 [Vibrio phage 1.244.A._10N.261.54.C3]|nr:hypothetical protein NVP1244A_141 [Vibrio phage 1.244.A._10N.261.54.C3]AUR98769.1 hypothetical protein NVP1255O_141 [Vibrio phage 1.255.O._10N.286.45.F1]